MSLLRRRYPPPPSARCPACGGPVVRKVEVVTAGEDPPRPATGRPGVREVAPTCFYRKTAECPAPSGVRV